MTTSKRICPRKKGGPPLYDALARSLGTMYSHTCSLLLECLSVSTVEGVNVLDLLRPACENAYGRSTGSSLALCIG